MAPAQLSTPLNNAQLELLKLFSRDLDETDLLAIKRLIVQYLAGKITQKADALWEEQEWSNEKMKERLQFHERTPYDPEN
ncbi:MAG: hypothetical protein KF852_16900 [Saprospiraceae bacterium]|nr:hypothetical protein [Saprospiraceae bacterium]